MENREYYEKEITKLLKQYNQQDIKVSEYYRNKTIECLLQINDAEKLQQAYRFVLALCN